MRRNRKTWTVPSDLKILSREDVEDITGRKIIFRHGRFIFKKTGIGIVGMLNKIRSEQYRLASKLERSRNCPVKKR